MTIAGSASWSWRPMMSTAFRTSAKRSWGWGGCWPKRGSAPPTSSARQETGQAGSARRVG